MQASLGTLIAEPFNSESFQRTWYHAEGLSWGGYSLKQTPKAKIPVQVDYLGGPTQIRKRGNETRK